MDHLEQTEAASQVFIGGTTAGRLVTVEPVHQKLQGTHIRQVQPQHSGSTFETASTSLLDILHQVPMLLELLTPDAQKALSATCKSCHAQFIAQVQVVTVLREDYSLVFERRWPRLRMVILQDVRCSAVDDSGLGFGLSKPSEAFRSLLEPSNYRVLKLHVATAPNKQAVICILTPLHTSATDLPCAQLAAQRLAHQLKVRWPSLRSFVMSPVDDQDVLGLEIVSQLVRGTWTGLAHLSLAGHKLKAQAFLLLSQGSWPGLTFLDVSDTCLDAEGMALLVKGNWPLLTSFTLSFDPTMDAVAILHIAAANWPIKVLRISGTPFDVDMAAKLADLQLPNLIQLYLMEADLTAPAVSELVRASWPSLNYISIDHSDLAALTTLFECHLEKVPELDMDPRIRYLDTVHRSFAWPIVPMGLWPNLKYVMISKHNVTCFLN